MILLASRIARFQQDNETKSFSEENFDNQPVDEDDLLLKQDKIIVWLSSNLQTNYSYTIAVRSINNRNKLKYYGPLLLADDKPVNIFNKGKCLILSHLYYKMLTDNDAQPLFLDIVIHS